MTPLAAIRRSSRTTHVALIALVALLFASTAYVAHGFNHDQPLSGHTTIQCDLCLHFSGSAGAPAQPGLVGKPPLAAFTPVAAEAPRSTPCEHPTHRLPRAPPALT